MALVLAHRSTTHETKVVGSGQHINQCSGLILQYYSHHTGCTHPKYFHCLYLLHSLSAFICCTPPIVFNLKIFVRKISQSHLPWQFSPLYRTKKKAAAQRPNRIFLNSLGSSAERFGMTFKIIRLFCRAEAGMGWEFLYNTTHTIQ